MPQYLMRIEAVNLGDSIYDTQDLATTRGGGLLALSIPDQVKKYSVSKGFKQLQSGASHGLFEFEAADAQSADRVRADILAEFLKDPTYRFITVAVDVVLASDRQSEIVALMTRNRWAQMQQPTLSVPCWQTAETADASFQQGEQKKQKPDVILQPERNDAAGQPCGVDRVRPRTTLRKGPRENNKQTWQQVSQSVKRRSIFGREQRKKFYGEICEKNRPAVDPLRMLLTDEHEAGHFTRDFDQLSSRSANWNKKSLPYPDDPKKLLHHKIALLYLDGNKFGEIQQGLNIDGLVDFSKQLKVKQGSFLCELLTRMHRGSQLPDEQCFDFIWRPEDEKPDRFRIEVLLWGGDEVLIVLPAWLGWWGLQTFYELSRDWDFRETPLTHGGGLVFCHHNAPIQRMKNLAKSKLADGIAKEDVEVESLNSQLHNRLAYEVLESYDVVGNVENIRQQRCGRDATDPSTSDPLIVHGHQMRELGEFVVALREQSETDHVSKRKLHQVLHTLALISRSQDEKSEKLDEFKTKLEKTIKTLVQGVNELERQRLLRSPNEFDLASPELWCHVGALWDYVWYPKLES